MTWLLAAVMLAAGDEPSNLEPTLAPPEPAVTQQAILVWWIPSERIITTTTTDRIVGVTVNKEGQTVALFRTHGFDGEYEATHYDLLPRTYWWDIWGEPTTKVWYEAELVKIIFVDWPVVQGVAECPVP